MLSALIFALALSQSAAEPTVTVHFGADQPSVTMTVTMAERMLIAARKAGNTALQATLTAALGTVLCHVAEQRRAEPSCEAQRAAGLIP